MKVFSIFSNCSMGGYAQPRRWRMRGTDRLANSRIAVMSFKSTGSSPTRSANATEPVDQHANNRGDDPVFDRAVAEQRLADHHRGGARHKDADAHADIGKTMILRDQRTGQRDRAVGEREADQLGAVGVDAERADHPFVFTGGADGEAEVGVHEAGEGERDDDQ
jgi:hypothetical protein